MNSLRWVNIKTTCHLVKSGSECSMAVINRKLFFKPSDESVWEKLHWFCPYIIISLEKITALEWENNFEVWENGNIVSGPGRYAFCIFLFVLIYFSLSKVGVRSISSCLSHGLTKWTHRLGLDGAISHVIEGWPTWRTLGVKDVDVEFGTITVLCGYISGIRLWTINPYFIANASFIISTEKTYSNYWLHIKIWWWAFTSNSATSMANRTQVYHLGNACGEESFLGSTMWSWDSWGMFSEGAWLLFQSICLVFSWIFDCD